MTTVVNIKHEKCDVFAGRGSIFGNPYVIGVDGTREVVIKRYRDMWFPFLLKDSVFKKALLAAKDKKLGCFCKGKDREVWCHVDILADYLNNLPAESSDDFI